MDSAQGWDGQLPKYPQTNSLAFCPVAQRDVTPVITKLNKLYYVMTRIPKLSRLTSVQLSGVAEPVLRTGTH
jgi:hypothetical protein